MMSAHERPDRPDRCGSSRRPRAISPRVLKLILGIGVLLVGIKVAAMAGWPRWPEASVLVVESALDDSVLVDVRTRSPAGDVEGPLAQPLAPGSQIVFSASPNRPVCVRVFVPGAGRLVPFRIEASEGGEAIRTTLRLSPSALGDPPPGAILCEPELAWDRVRPTLGRYFEPDQPDVLRRERILSRRRF